MPRTDQLHRFVFDNSDVRGEIISLSESYLAVLENGRYPAPVALLLGEMLAAVGLLSATLKFDGTISLQARGEGDLSLAMADCTRHRLLRGIARLKDDANPETGNILELLGKGHLAITIDPARGERYQGIVPLEDSSLSACLESYFRLSEQIPTRLWLHADGERAAGLLLQALPARHQTPEERDDYWQHLATLADTLGGEELLAEDNETLLRRLFHGERTRVFEPETPQFACSCSRERTAQMLRSLGEREVRSIIEERGLVEVDCQFCHQQYRFDRTEVDRLFSPSGSTLH
jgi:molecular chaperone Hsp33